MNTNILSQFNDVELVEELKKRGFLCSASAWYKAECEILKEANEALKERIRVLESQNVELKERVKDLENYLEID